MSMNLGSSSTQEVDLNITPIIDCFTVLITFLLASASFLSIGFFETYTPGQSSNPTEGEPDTEVVIRIKGNHFAELKAKGKKNLTLSFKTDDAAQMKGLEEQLQNLKSPDIKLNQVLVSADDTVDYQELSQMLGHVNTANLPVVVGEF